MMKHDPEAPHSIALLPESLREAFNPAKDPILEAIRSEAIALLSEPMHPRRLRVVNQLLEHADQILQLRQGAPRGKKRRRGPYQISSSDFSGMSYGPEADDSDGPLSDSSPTETMGTHAFREIIGITTKALEAFTATRSSASEELDATRQAMAAESYIRALATAQDLPADMRAKVVERLQHALSEVLPGPEAASSAPAAGGDVVETVGTEVSPGSEVQPSPGSRPLVHVPHSQHFGSAWPNPGPPWPTPLQGGVAPPSASDNGAGVTEVAP
jgi:hypothetical protein